MTISRATIAPTSCMTTPRHTLRARQRQPLSLTPTIDPLHAERHEQTLRIHILTCYSKLCRDIVACAAIFHHNRVASGWTTTNKSKLSSPGSSRHYLPSPWRKKIYYSIMSDEELKVMLQMCFSRCRRTTTRITFPLADPIRKMVVVPELQQALLRRQLHHGLHCAGQLRGELQHGFSTSLRREERAVRLREPTPDGGGDSWSHPCLIHKKRPAAPHVLRRHLRVRYEGQ